MQRPDDIAHHIELEISLGEVARLNRWLDEVAPALDLSTPLVLDIRLCLDEAVTNAISYGFEGQAAGRIRVEAKRQAERIVVTIADTGRLFDPLSAPLTEAPEDIEHAAIGGLGIKLIRSTADHSDYARQDGENRLTLYFEAPR